MKSNNKKISRLGSLILPSKGISRKRYYLYYTIIFAIAVFAVFSIFFLNGKTFIWNVDGWTQCYKALVYYARWLRSILKGILFAHQLEIPAFSFSIGYGSDIMTTLEYYVVGDPFSFFSFLVPTRYMAIYYDFMLILRIYLAGIAFSSYCFYKEDQQNQGEYEGSFSKVAILTGSLIYIFSGYTLYSCVADPYFANPLLYFPLVLIGVEKILDKKKPWLFIFMVFISAVSNFYFFYMIAIMTALYVIYRLVIKYHWSEIRHALVMFVKIAGYSILGTCASAVILLPVVLMFLGDARSATGNVYNFFYSLADYGGIFGNFISLNNSTDYQTLGYATIGLLTVFLLFLSKEHRALKFAFIALTGIMLLPIAGSITNGLSYPANRWIWAYGFLISYIVVIEWQDLFKVSAKTLKQLILCLVAYFLICMVLTKSRSASVFFSVAIILISVLIITVIKDQCGFRYAQVAILVCVVVNLSGNAVFEYSPRNNDFVSEFVDMDKAATNLMSVDSTAIIDASEDTGEFFRYSGSLITQNATLHSGLSDTQYYWSLSNGNISEYQVEMELTDRIWFHNYTTLDSRTFISTLANVKYYVQNDTIPFGFSYLNSNNDIKVWDNEYFLPFGYTYDNYISREEYYNMTPIEKQEALLQGCVIDSSYTVENEAAEVSYTSELMPYEVSESEGIHYSDNCIDVTEENATLTLTFCGMDKAETYLYLTNLAYEGYSPRELYSDEDWDNLSQYERNEVRYENQYYIEEDSIKVNLNAIDDHEHSSEATLTYFTPQYRFYTGRTDFMVNLGYDKYGQVSITMQFPTTGKYTFDTLEVLCQPMDNYADQVAALGAETMGNVDFHENEAFATNQVTGDIHLSEDKYLLLTIPYSSGWTATVDGEEQELLRANTMYMALRLNAGDHSIVLNYQTPGKTMGWIVSIVSFAILIVMMAVSYIRRKTIQNKKESE